MVGWLLQHLQLVRKALRGRSESPRRLAAAVALGVVLGLIPKGNLIAAAVTVVILGSTANAGAALLTATAVSFAAVLVDPLSHRVGLSILTSRSLYPFWEALYQLPVVPWTNFNHTVVLGGLIVGLVVFYPAYRLSYAFFNRNNADRASGTEQREADDTLKPEEAAKQSLKPEAPAKEAITLPESPGKEAITLPESPGKEAIALPASPAKESLKPEAPAEESLSLWESRALRPGEGPTRPLPRRTSPLRGQVLQ